MILDFRFWIDDQNTISILLNLYICGKETLFVRGGTYERRATEEKDQRICKEYYPTL
jgi:hypothetical protein